jgi:hypothetical protein
MNDKKFNVETATGKNQKKKKKKKSAHQKLVAVLYMFSIKI